MPLPRVTTKVNKTVFQCFSPNSMSEDEEEGSNWAETGAFPQRSPNNSSTHIFTDEPFENDFTSLEKVEEGSKETQETTSNDGFAAFSPTSSETPAVDNRMEMAMRKIFSANKQAPRTPTGSHGASSGSSKGAYPFNIYESLARLEEKKRRDQDTVSPLSSAEKPSNAAGSFVSSSSVPNQGNTKKVDVEGMSMPSPLTPMTLAEEPSVISETQSQIMEAESNQGAPMSVASVRSRRHSRRYIVRHTLSTTQQVNANPATMLKNLFIGIEQERHMHKLAGQNLHAIHDWFLFLPCIGLTLLSGLVVLIFQADIQVSDGVRVYASLCVGVFALFSVFLQAVSKMLNMGTRATLHEVTACILKRLSEDILLTLSSTENIPAEYVALVSEKFGQALDSCTSPIPHKLEAAFSAVSDRMDLMIRPPTGQPARKHVHKLDYMRLYSTVYDELNSEMIHFWAWPFLFPRPRSASEATLRNFIAIITEGRDAVQRKKGCMRLCCDKEPIERSLFEVVPPASVSDGPTANNGYHNRSTTVGPEV